MAHTNTNKLLLSLVALVLLLLLHVAPTHQNAVKWTPQTSADAVDLFWRYIGQEGSQLGPASARKTMQQAAQSGLTYLRVAAMGNVTLRLCLLPHTAPVMRTLALEPSCIIIQVSGQTTCACSKPMRRSTGSCMTSLSAMLAQQECALCHPFCGTALLLQTWYVVCLLNLS